MRLKVREFDFKDLDAMKEWLTARGLTDEPDPKYLPPRGYTCELDGKAIAVGFLVVCDNSMGIFTDFLSDLRVDRELRRPGVMMIREALEKDAKRIGITYICSYTTIKRHAKRLESYGWKKLDKGLIQMGRFI